MVEYERAKTYHHSRCVHFRKALEPRHLQEQSLADVRSAPPSAKLAALHDDPVTALEAPHALPDARDLSKPFVPAHKHAPLNSGEGRRLRLGRVHPFDHIHVRWVYRRQDEAQVHCLRWRGCEIRDGEGTHDICRLAILGVDDGTVRLYSR